MITRLARSRAKYHYVLQRFFFIFRHHFLTLFQRHSRNITIW